VSCPLSRKLLSQSIRQVPHQSSIQILLFESLTGKLYFTAYSAKHQNAQALPQKASPHHPTYSDLNLYGQSFSLHHPNGIIFQNNGFQVAFSHLKLGSLVLQFDHKGEYNGGCVRQVIVWLAFNIFP
jgi:hypothetical protein